MSHPQVDHHPARIYAGVAEDGSEVRVEVGEGLDPHLARFWPPVGLRRWPWHGAGRMPEASFVLTPTGRGDGCLVRRDGSRTPGGWLRLESDLSLFAADHLVDRVAIHGGLVSARGATVLLPGPSMAGKSTLCLALTDRGAVVHSDEYALVCPRTGFAVGWPRPMRRRRADGTTDRVELPRPGGPAVRIDLVASLRYAPEGEGIWTRQGEVDAVCQLLANTVSARRRPAAALDAAIAVAAGADAVQGRRGDAGGAADRLLELLDSLGAVEPQGPGWDLNL